MPYYCTVPRCTSMAGKAKNVSFHQFPRDEGLADLWNTILKRGKPYTKYSKVCSLHFKPEDYTITSVGKNKGQWRTLRKDAIPSQNLPSDSPTPQRRRSSQRERVPSPLTPILQKLQIQQQLANAMFMQTVLAMQAANHLENQPSTTDSDEGDSNNCNEERTESIPNEVPQSSSYLDVDDNLRHTQPLTHTLPQNRINLDKTNNYNILKCAECSKCFMDFDVFLLHQRSHKDAATEKENYSKSLNI